jgi:hypothetical protein
MHRDINLKNMTVKEINTLRSQLEDWEQEVTEAIAAELSRIGRRVLIEEFTYNPFNSDIARYVNGINLDEEFGTILYTSFANTDCKHLASCMSDSEIDSWGLISLLDGLKSKTSD